MPRLTPLFALLLMFASIAALAEPEKASALSPDSVNAATGDAAGALLRAQVLLERARFSPGEIDGRAGSNTARAIAGFQRARDLEPSGKLDEATWEALAEDRAPALVTHTLAAEDVAG